MGRLEKPLDPQQRLALEGGAPVRTQPFAPWPHFAADEIAAVAAVLRSGKVNYWTGEQSQQFEREFARFVGVKYAVAAGQRYGGAGAGAACPGPGPR